MRVVDLDRLYGLHQIIWSEVSELGIHDEMSDLSTALICEALFALGHDPGGHCTFIPEGVTPDEVMAAEYDEDCLMCQCEAQEMRERRAGPRNVHPQIAAEEKGLEKMFSQRAAAWRAEYREQLKRFGLSVRAS